MGVVTVVVTRWSRTLTRERNWWFWKVAISKGISTTFFKAISKNKYGYITGETAGSPLKYTSIQLHLIVRPQTILSTMQPTRVKTPWSTKLNTLKYSIIYLWCTCFHTQKPMKSFSVHKNYNRLLSSK